MFVPSCMMEEIAPEEPVLVVEDDSTNTYEVSELAYEDTESMLEELLSSASSLRKIDDKMVTAFGAISKVDVKALRKKGEQAHRLSYLIENPELGSVYNYIVEVKPNASPKSWYIEYENHGSWDLKDFRSFTGTIRYYDAKGELVLEHKMVNGQPESPKNARTCYAEWYEYGHTKVTSPAGTTIKDVWVEPRTSIVKCDSKELLREIKIDERIGGGGGSPINIDPEERRRQQLNYLKTHAGIEGKDFANGIEELLKTAGLTVGDVAEINKMVDQFYYHIKGTYLMVPFMELAIASKPFLELALIETGSAAFLSAVKKLLQVKWSLQISKAINVNTISPSQSLSRIESSVSLSSTNSLQIKYNGKWLTSQTGKSGTYEFHGLSEAEARGVFRELTAGRKINPITHHKQGWNIDHMGYRIGDKTYTIGYRTEASSSGAHATIELKNFNFGYKKIKFKSN